MKTNSRLWIASLLGLMASSAVWADGPRNQYVSIYQNGYMSGYNICYEMQPDTVNDIIYTPIDMGSGVAWADRNIGAKNPEDGGTCFYWGDVSGDEIFSESNYYPDVRHLVANTTILAPEYDAAHVILGEHWRMPTKQEIGMLNNFMFYAPPSTGGVESDYNIEQSYEEGVGLTCTYKNDPTRYILIPESDWYTPNKQSKKKVCFWTGIIGNQVNQFNNQQNSSAIHYTYSTSFNQGTYSAANIYYGMPVRAVYQPTCEVCTLTIHVKATGKYCIFYNNDGSCLEEETGSMIYVYAYICEKGQKVTVYPLHNDGTTGCTWLQSDGKTAVTASATVDPANNTFIVNSDMTYYADFSNSGGGGGGGGGGSDTPSTDLGSEASFKFGTTDIITGTTKYCTDQNSYWNGENFVLITARHPQSGTNAYFNIGIRTTNTQTYNGYTAPAVGTYQVVTPERYYATDYWTYEEEYYYFNTTDDVVPSYTQVCAKYDYYGDCTQYGPITQTLFLSSYTSGTYIDAAPYNDLSTAAYVKVSMGKDGYYFLQVFNSSGQVLVSIGEPAVQQKASYLVKHYTQDLGKTTYTLAYTDTLTGFAQTTVTPTTKNITGFTTPAATSLTISADGTSVKEYYYSRQTYTLTIQSTTGGTITVKNGNTNVGNGAQVEYGTILTLTATPNANYSFGTWTGDGASTITMDGPKTIGATFIQTKTYSVTLYEGAGCDIRFSDGTSTCTEYDHAYSFPEGTTLTFTMQSSDKDYDYGEFLDEDLNTLYVGKTWTVSLTQDMTVLGYSAIGEFVLQDVLPTTNYYTDSIPWGKNVHKVTLKRTFTARQWTNLCLPFTAVLSDTQKSMLYAMERATLNGNQLSLSFSKIDMMEEGQPYLLYYRSKVENMSWTYIMFPDSPIEAGSYTEDAGKVTYQGVLQNPVLLPAGNRYNRYMSSNTIYIPSASGSGVTIAHGRAYFKIKDGILENGVAPRLQVMVDGEVVMTEDTTEDITPVTKFIENGVLVIERNSKRYTADGKEWK